MRPKIFSELVHVTQIQEMTERGYWAPLGYISKPFDRSKLKVNSTGANYTDDSIKQAMIEQDVVQQAYEMALILKKEGRKKILIFMPEIAMAEELAEMLGVNAVSSKTKKKEREEYINNFKAGIDFAIINVNVLAVGFDDQRIDAIIDGKPTMSLGIYYQKYGRGVRVDLSTNPVKHDCLIVDLVGNYEMFGKIEDFIIKKNAIGKWALFCGDKQLTNTELVKDKNVNLEDEIMGFGKYKGEPFRFIPKSYWRFIRDNFKRSAENEKLFNYIETIEL
jgi:DNA repair protein RadD